MENTKTNENSFCICSSQSPNLSSSSSETVSSASYLSFFERRKTTEHANLYAKKWSHRKLKLLEKSFELEKQRIVNEVMKDENKTTPKIRQK